jgi:hypothetical protein
VYLNEQELNEFLETDEEYVWCKVTRISSFNSETSRIYCNSPKPYIPEYDVTGTEVFLEEWKKIKDPRCKKCNKMMYWKDINLSRFKYKPTNNHRLICKECMKP